jgi:FHS family glucose/mannose:H+ symporter-like MFS transporter
MKISALPGFFLSGFLLALLGAALPGWSYHYTEQHAQAGWLFFALSSGVFLGGQIWRRFLPLVPARKLCLAASALAILPLLLPGLLSSPIRFEVQIASAFTLGAAAGLLNVALFQAIRADYRADPAGTAIRAGIYFGAGCFASAGAVATAFHWGFISQTPAALALVPALFFLWYLRGSQQWAVAEPESGQLSPRILSEFSRAGAVLFALLLLFQSGSEWTVAGWLPLFLTHRIGLSPEDALWMLALFWFALALARGATIFLLPRARHSKILFSGAAAALVGCFLLIYTDNSLGAVVAILLLSGGFAAVYPLLAEKMGNRFPTYNPDVFNSVFSLALSGGLLSPWLAGMLAQSWGLTAVMILPAIFTFFVVALLLVLWLESKVTGR